MKRLLLTVLTLLTLNTNVSAQLTMTVFWKPGSTNLMPTYFYMSTNDIWLNTNRNNLKVLVPVGLTNYITPITTNRLYSMYVTSLNTNTTAETRPSNQIRYQLFPFIRGKTNYPFISLDYFGTNWSNFQIVTQPTNGIVTGTLPNLTYTPTNKAYFLKDRFVYKSPEIFAETNILYYYSVHFVNTNFPTVIQDAVGL